MARPSQCPVCGCFVFCLAAGAQGCAQDEEEEVPAKIEQTH